jgi:hypothetical protein
MDWVIGHDGYSAHCDTVFARFQIEVDWPSSRKAGGDAIRFEARMCNATLHELARQTDFESLEYAQGWCLAMYKRFLNTELASLPRAS